MSIQNCGLIRESAGHAVLKLIPMPHMSDDYILVRVVTIALNPTEWTTLDALGDAGTLMGCDYAGIVEAVGKNVQRTFKKGDRIAGFGHGGNDANPENGAFARFIAVKGDLQLHIPDNVTFEEACTVGVGICTSGYALYNVLGLPFPDECRISEQSEEKEPILIYGGSTASGTIAVQLAKLSGRKVFTTCSPQHFDLVRSLGADIVFDYREPNVGAAINAATANSLTHILDTVGLDSTAAICAAAMTSSGLSHSYQTTVLPSMPPSKDPTDPRTKIYCNLLGASFPRSDAQNIFFLGYSMSGESYIFEGERYDARPADLEFAKSWVGRAEKLWRQGKLRAHPWRLGGDDGLRGVVRGLQEGREGRIRGFKVVFRVEDTVW